MNIRLSRSGLWLICAAGILAGGSLSLAQAPLDPGSAPAKAPAIQWTAFPDGRLTVNGLPWFEQNHRSLYRLPLQFKEAYTPSVRGAANDTTGVRIRFRTDSTLIAIRLEYRRRPYMVNMSPIGQSGVDLYVGDAYWGNISADKDAAPGKIYEHLFFDFSDEPRVEREITFHLPLYDSVKVVAIGLDEHAKIEPPRPFAIPAPILFYGTSLTQGGCVSRPGMSYSAIVGRLLNVDFVNLGFSGVGKYELPLGQQVATAEVSCFILDGTNIAEAADLARVYGPFVDALRARHPRTPIVAISAPYSTQEITKPEHRRQLAEKRAFTKKFVQERTAGGDRNIYYIAGTDLLNASQGAGLVDGAHFNDLGSNWFSVALAKRLAPILRLRLNQP